MKRIKEQEAVHSRRAAAMVSALTTHSNWRRVRRHAGVLVVLRSFLLSSQDVRLLCVYVEHIQHQQMRNRALNPVDPKEEIADMVANARARANAFESETQRKVGILSPLPAVTLLGVFLCCVSSPPPLSLSLLGLCPRHAVSSLSLLLFVFV